MVKSGGRPRESSMRLNHREIADDLAARIAATDPEIVGPDKQLPSYRQLAERYDVSKSTILRALSLLHERQIIRGEPGRGVYVRERGET